MTKASAVHKIAGSGFNPTLARALPLSMRSARFGKDIAITQHARERMREREIDEATLFDTIETGELKRVEGAHCFIFKHHRARRDNLVCAAVVVDETRLIVKTVMIRWKLRGTA